MTERDTWPLDPLVGVEFSLFGSLGPVLDPLMQEPEVRPWWPAISGATMVGPPWGQGHSPSLYPIKLAGIHKMSTRKISTFYFIKFLGNGGVSEYIHLLQNL